MYNYRIFDRHRKPVVSLAVLADEGPAWKPKPFSYGLWGFSITMEFPVVKLNDYRKQWDELEKSRNPFAVAVMAHLKTQETRHDHGNRRKWKLRLIRNLYERGYDRQDVINPDYNGFRGGHNILKLLCRKMPFSPHVIPGKILKSLCPCNGSDSF
ncbi:Uncharacterized protein dnm_072990 [Desulfonema magnum]|uniref:Uncharacterized protein n=1 Tax=Desulfonema magnum TaxID=45655 RepID=A0A975BT95_9BACT|nr:Uncharacterized protein dnm_072990 [Desulfonema magnum]